MGAIYFYSGDCRPPQELGTRLERYGRDSELIILHFVQNNGSSNSASL